MPTTTPQKPAPVTPTGCCPVFDPAPWNETEVVWRDHLFVKEHVTSLFHVPLNLGRKVAKAMARIEDAKAKAPQGLMLSDETSPWGSELYIDVTGPVPGATMTSFSGRFLTKVYDGPFRDARKWMADMNRYVEAKGEHAQKIYLAYTTCPRCAKAYGHNYVVLFAKIAAPPN